MTTFSIAMATYNGARFLPDQLSSIADQEECPHELVVVDDASVDGTLDLLEDFSRNSPFPVKIRTNSHNMGSTASFESAIAACSGELIALADQDDLWLPGRLASASEVFRSSKTVGAVFCNAGLIDANSVPLGRTTFQQFGLHYKNKRVRGMLNSRLLFNARFVVGATLAFRSCFRDLLLPIPTFPSEERPFLHDAWIACLISTQAELFADERVMVNYRQHPDQQVGALSAVGQSVLRRRRPSLELTRLACTRLQQANLFDSSIDISVVDYLELQSAHFATRDTLQSTTLSRSVFPVLAELLAGRYHRFSSGFKSALGDLIRE